MEQWKDIPGYEGEYQVSSEGRVKSLARTCSNGRGTRVVPERILKPSASSGYYHVAFRHNRTQAIHRLVAEAFIPNPDGMPIVDHINGDQLDNRVENLRWVDQQSNTLNAWMYRRIAELEAEVESLRLQLACRS